MKKNIFRSVIVSFVAFFVVAGAANAVGVFYYDSATNQFVLDGNLKISDPGSFKLFLRELNAANDDNLYINGRKDVQIRMDTDNNGANNQFNVNNGANSTVFSVDEGGNLTATGNANFKNETLSGNLKLSDGNSGGIQVGKYDASHPNGYIAGAVGAGLVLQSQPGSDRVVITPSSVVFPSASGSGGSVVLKNGRILFDGGLDTDDAIHTWGVAMSIRDGASIIWGGGWRFGHTTSGYYWGNESDDYLTLDNTGRMIVYGGEGVSAYKFCLPGGGGFANCITSWPSSTTTSSGYVCDASHQITAFTHLELKMWNGGASEPSCSSGYTSGSALQDYANCTAAGCFSINAKICYISNTVCKP